MRRPAALLAAAALLPLAPGVVGCAPGVACSQTADTPSGLTIGRGLVVGTMHLACTAPPDSFHFTIILVRNRQMLHPGRESARIPGAAGYDVTTFAECHPGTWHVYYLATWSYQGQTTSNPTTTLADKRITDGDCRAHGG